MEESHHWNVVHLYSINRGNLGPWILYFPKIPTEREILEYGFLSTSFLTKVLKIFIKKVLCRRCFFDKVSL